MNEQQLAKKVTAYLKTKAPGTAFLKVHGHQMQTRGWPDYMGVTMGTPWVIELKHPNGKGKLTKLQIHYLEALKKAGSHVLVAKSEQEVSEFIEQIEKQRG
jgi:hypothetical protein